MSPLGELDELLSSGVTWSQCETTDNERYVAERSGQEDEFRHREAAQRGRHRLDVKVTPSYATGQRSRSADPEHLRAPYDISTSRYSTIASDYRHLSRCWYDVAVARATVANSNQTRQRVSFSSMQSTDSDQPQQLASAQVAQLGRRPTSSAVDDVTCRQTGSEVTSSALQLSREHVVYVVVHNGDVDRSGSRRNKIDMSSEQRRSRDTARRNGGQDLTCVQQRRRTKGVEVQVPRRCRSASATRRRTLSTEMKLTRTTTTTETTTTTRQHRRRRHHQQHDDTRSRTQHCLATVVTTNTSQVVSHDSSVVAIDNDDSAPSSGEVSDVTDGVHQLDDATETSKSCDVTLTLETHDDVTHLLIESASVDVTTDVANDDDGTAESDVRSLEKATESSPVTVDRHEDTTRHDGLNVSSTEIFVDNSLSTKNSDKGKELHQLEHKQRHVENRSERGRRDDSSCLLASDELDEHGQLSVVHDSQPSVNTVTVSEAGEHSKLTVEDVDDVDEEKEVEPLTTDDFTVSDADHLSRDISTSDGQTAAAQQLRKIAFSANTADVDCRDSDAVERVDENVAQNVLNTVDDVSNMDRIDSEHSQDTDQSDVTALPQIHPHQSNVDDTQPLVAKRNLLKPVFSDVDDVIEVQLDDVKNDVARSFNDVEGSARVSSNKVDTKRRENGAVPPVFLSTLSIDCGDIRTGDDVIPCPFSGRHVTSLVVLELAEVEEMNDLQEVIQTRYDTRPELAERTDDTPAYQAHNQATAVNVGDDNTVSVDADGSLQRTDDVSIANNDRTFDPTTPRQTDVQQYPDHCQQVCLHLYDDSHLSLTTDFGTSDTSGQAVFYVDHWQTKIDETDEICSTDSSEVPNANALFDAVFVSGVRTTVQSEEIQSDVSEISEQYVTVSTMSVASDDSVAVVKSSRQSDVEVKSLTEESCEPSVSAVCCRIERDEVEVDSGRLVLHDYGEMWSVFREIPLWVEVLRAEVIERHNNDPRISRLLTRYPRLRPSTWMWTTPPLVADLQQRRGLDSELESRPAASVHRGVSQCWSYPVQPVIERCTLVIE